MDLVRYLHSKRKPLLYGILDTLMDSLSAREKRYLVDFIINEYSFIDFQRAISYYGTYERMTDAFSNNTGSEYDIEEEYDYTAGKDYKLMANYLALDKRHRNIGDVLHRTAEERLAYLNEMVCECHVSVDHARKFLRIGKAETLLKFRR